MTKPRLLIPMSIQFSVRYLLRSGMLERLRDVVQPVILLAWKDEVLETELRQAGMEVHPMIERKMGKDYDRVRSWMSLLHKRQLATSSEGVWERRSDLERTSYQRWRRRARKRIFHMAAAIPGTEDWLRRKEKELWETDNNIGEFRAQMDRLKPDAALSLTPFLLDEEMAMRVCEERGIPLCTSLLSFDFVTTRGWWAVKFDRYMVWNRYNAQELLRSHPEICAEQVEIVGAPQFDFYYDPSYLWSETEWRQQLGLPADRPVILFAGGFYFCAPHEPRFLQQVDEAIERGEIPGNPVILFRNHPIDPIERWLPILKQAKHIVYDDPWPTGRIKGHSNMRTNDIQKLASCLYHSKIHINIASTMAIDGAIFDRPQIAPAYDDSPNPIYSQTSRDLYTQEHYLPITNSGGLEIVYSRDEFIKAIREGLVNPGRMAEGRKKLVREICTFADGHASERVTKAVRAFLETNILADEAVAKSA